MLLRPVEREAVEEFERVRRAHLGDVVDGAFVHRDGEDLGLQALAAAGRARNDGEVAGQLLALSVGLSLLVAALHCGQRSLHSMYQYVSRPSTVT